MTEYNFVVTSDDSYAPNYYNRIILEIHLHDQVSNTTVH